jgi:hypothetical protein
VNVIFVSFTVISDLLMRGIPQARRLVVPKEAYDDY